MKSSKESQSKEKTGNFGFFTFKNLNLRKKMYSSNERLAVQEFMHSFRKRLSSIKPNFRLFKYPYAESNNKESNDDEKETGISTNMSALFVSSAITGSAILYLPLALKESGWLGVFMIIICGINSLYAGMILGWCWNIMQESWPEYKKPNEIPYPEMGRRAVGDWMKYMVMVFLIASQVGTCIVYFVLISKHIEAASSEKLKFCYMMILALFLISPLTWFRTPTEFW
ncbi:Amino acid transporter AVT1E like protein [Argiope bruennichi]|uniref:Amino acid transporter AVT1E like protein n=1 Tax=Argiope bruennichi TaxID=94029 RepID=A0A8T0EBR6_ARGBR|nr:Amino acid transporter AVT1E like protein [Argiope bruennichi]